MHSLCNISLGDRVYFYFLDSTFLYSTKMPIISKAKLKLAIENRLKECGFERNATGFNFPDKVDKEVVRRMHAPNRIERYTTNQNLLKLKSKDLITNFASGSDIVPAAIDPELIEVKSDTPESDLFRFATMLWSVPVSPGFGRRLRFLVRDRSNGKLIGLFALGDPVFNLTARDKQIGWTSKDRAKRLVHVMDAFVIGAVPPYSFLIGGKLVAALIGSTEVKRAYERHYLNAKSVISHRRKHAHLVLATTTSALGRSSIYNRLKIPNGPIFMPVGLTKGFGHFHLAGTLFELMRKYLTQRHHPYASGHKFGMGPNWKIRVARAAIENAGLNGNSILKHGIEREVYLIPLATNWKQILLGKQKNLHTLTLPASEIADYCKKRWIIPRSERDESYKSFLAESLLERIETQGQQP